MMQEFKRVIAEKLRGEGGNCHATVTITHGNEDKALSASAGHPCGEGDLSLPNWPPLLPERDGSPFTTPRPRCPRHADNVDALALAFAASGAA
jgi:hypothetical protein